MNKTDHYKLNQITNNDKPGWRTTYNEDMRSIDAALHEKVNMHVVPMGQSVPLIDRKPNSFYLQITDTPSSLGSALGAVLVD